MTFGSQFPLRRPEYNTDKDRTTEKHSNMNVVRCSLSVLLWATLSASLFQEDVGVIDWTHSLIGTPVLSVSFGESLIVASSHSVLSRISGDSGEIQWRQAHESPIASLSVSLPPHASSASSHSPGILTPLP